MAILGRVTIKDIENVEPSKLARMSDEQLDKFLRGSQKAINRRIASLKKSGLYSHAFQRLIDNSVGEKNQKDYSTDTLYTEGLNTYSNYVKNRQLSRNGKLAEIYKIQNFVNSVTSTVPGIKRVNKEQDIRIFGVKPQTVVRPDGTRVKTTNYWELSEAQKKKAQPLRTMTQDERQHFWSIQREYRKLWEPGASYSTDSYLQALGNVFAEEKTLPDFGKALQDMWLNLNPGATTKDYYSAYDSMVRAMQREEEEIEAYSE